MAFSDQIKAQLSYGKELVESGVAGANEARKAAFEAAETSELIAHAASESWQGAAVGALVGAILGVLADDRKPARGVIAGGLLGAAVGFGGSFAWKTRPITESMARGAARRINATRDEHWLEENPVAYG